MLSDAQIELILPLFRNTNCPIWQNVAIKLLKSGKCIVAGNKNIWTGGVSNFITTHKTEDLFDCLEYRLDLNSFLKSAFVNDHFNDKLKDWIKEKEYIEQKIKNIQDIFEDK